MKGARRRCGRHDFATVYNHRTRGVAPGLYLGVLYAQNTFAGLDVLVPKASPYALRLRPTDARSAHRDG